MRTEIQLVFDDQVQRKTDGDTVFLKRLLHFIFPSIKNKKSYAGENGKLLRI